MWYETSKHTPAYTYCIRLCNKNIPTARVSVYLLYCFADNLLVLVLCDFLLLVKWFDGCLHFIYSFLLDLLFLE